MTAAGRTADGSDDGRSGEEEYGKGGDEERRGEFVGGVVAANIRSGTQAEGQKEGENGRV